MQNEEMKGDARFQRSYYISIIEKKYNQDTTQCLLKCITAGMYDV